MGQGNVERLNVLTRQQGPHGLYGALHCDRDLPAQFGAGPVNTLQSRLDIQRILARLQ